MITKIVEALIAGAALPLTTFLGAPSLSVQNAAIEVVWWYRFGGWE